LKRVYGGAWVDTLVRGTTAVAHSIATFWVTGALLLYASFGASVRGPAPARVYGHALTQADCVRSPQLAGHPSALLAQT